MDQFQRLELLINKDNLDKIKKLKVLVIGLGGVGGYVVESLIRSGIEHIILVDYDKIDITNLNRQIIANLDNIGSLKTDEFEKRIKSINNLVEVIKINSFIDESNYQELFNYNIDYLIDCCDTINTKKLIIKECLKRNIKFISSMGMGNKMDPTKIKIMDLSKTSYDKIAKILRKWQKDEIIKRKITVCVSDEEPIKINNNIIGSNAFVPSSAGLIITAHIINEIIKDN